MLVTDFFETRCYGVEGFVPRDSLKGLMLTALRKLGLGDSGAAAHRVEQTVGRVDAVKVLRDLAAKKAAGDGVVGVAVDSGGTACLVNGD